MSTAILSRRLDRVEALLNSQQTPRHPTGRPDLNAIRARADALKLGERGGIPEDIAVVCEQDVYHLLSYVRRLEQAVQRISKAVRLSDA